MRSSSSGMPFVFVLLFAVAACATTGGMGDPASDPQTVAGDYLQGRFAVSQQAYERAADAFSRAAGEQADPELVTRAFRYALAAGKFDDAATFAAVIDAAPTPEDEARHAIPVLGFLENDLPRLTLIADAFRSGDTETATRLLEARFQSVLSQAMAHLLTGWAKVGEGDDLGAARHLADVPAGTFAGFAPLHVAIVLDNAGETGAAESAYAEALAAPGAEVAFRAYAGFVEREKPREEALEFFQKLTEDSSFLSRIGRMGLARIDAPLEGESREFQKQARRASDRVATTPREGAALTFLNFAWTSYRQALSQEEAAAEAGFGEFEVNLEVPLVLAQLAAAVNPDLDAAHYVIGAIAAHDGHHARAETAYARVAPTSWLYNFATIDRAEALVALDRENEAIRLLKTYARHDALAPEVLLTLADLYAQDDETRDAIRTAGQAIETATRLSSDATFDDILWRYYFVRGAIHSDAGNWPEAEADLRRALDLAPDQPTVLNFLGYSYVERGENLNEAFGMIEQALEARPGSGAITDSLGWAYYQRGDYDKAVELLEQAVELSPGDDVITDHLGDAYWQSGRKAEARFEWRRVLEIENLDPELRASVEQKLGGMPPRPGTLAPAGNLSGD